jgi:DMSO/TMAO reductase YedYZ molybdopterin-dependent catalytic subunit
MYISGHIELSGDLLMRTSLSLAAKATLLACVLFSTGVALAAPSTQFSVGGSVYSPTTLIVADLEARPAVTQAVTFATGSGPQTHTYTGTNLWGILGSAGIVTDPGVKNDVLNKYVLATGSDGYKVVFSLGELSPNFGNRPDLVAYAETIGGVTSPLGADGFARITAPGDVKGGRYVSNLIDLTVRSSGSTQAATGGGVSSAFSVSGAVTSAMSFDLAGLQALPAIVQTVGSHTYTGVSFWDLLSATVGLDIDPGVKNDVLGMYVVATGSDGYRALFSLGELSSAFGNQPDLIAFEVDGTSLGDNGFARIVVPNDMRAGRWVSNLVSLEVFSTAVPEPSTYLLMAGGLALAGSVARRRRIHGRESLSLGRTTVI